MSRSGVTEINPSAAEKLQQEKILLAESDGAQGELYDLIVQSGFFSNLDREEIVMLALWMKGYSAPTGTMLLQEGDENASLCIIVEGEVNIFKKTSDFKHVKIAEIGSGASIGEMGVIDGEPLSASAITATDSTVLVMTPEDFNNLMEKNSNLAVKILLQLAQIISLRLRHTTRRLADLLAVKKP